MRGRAAQFKNPVEAAHAVLTKDFLNAQIKDVVSKSPNIEMGDISDGYHTFNELYDHRITLFIVLCNLMVICNRSDLYEMPWKSKKHSDGTMFDGWFIAGIGTKNGEQITYHLPIAKWNDLKVKTLPKAPEWDGHTLNDVLDRLMEVIKAL